MNRTNLLKHSVCAGAAALAALFSVSGAAKAQTGFALRNGDRVVMYGDSITDQRLYSIFTEAYVTTRFPKLKIDWTHSGWGGDRVSGGGGGPIDQRIQRDVLAYKPTVMTIMLGMNDASYRAFDQGIFDTFAKGYQHILDTVSKNDPGVRFTLIQPSPFDDVTREAKFPGGYNAVLVRYGNYLKDLGQKTGSTVADANTPIVTMLQKANTANPTEAQKLIPDRVHPQFAAHLILAEGVLKSWNAPALVSAVALDAAGKKVTRADNALVKNVSAAGETLAWDTTENALPMPLDLKDVQVNLVVNSSDFLQTLDQETLQVTGLSAPRYTLTIDGGSTAVGTFTREELASGVNLATLETPMQLQARKVMELTVKHVNLHNMRWRQIQVPFQTDKDPGVQKSVLQLMNAMDNLEQGIVAQQRAAAQPVSHHFALTPSP